jgi:hypothetical protein
VAVLQVIEQANGGWGMGLHFVRVAYIPHRQWYLTWLTSLRECAFLRELLRPCLCVDGFGSA